MEEEKNLLNELMKRYIELKMSVERMEAEQKHSPGCIVKKGANKQYYYWQKCLDGKVVQEYLELEKVQEVEKQIQEANLRKKSIKEKRQYLRTIGKMLKTVGIKEENIINEYEILMQKKEKEKKNLLTSKEEASKKKYGESYRHITDKGEQVASKSEVIIANLLYSYGVEYEYEKVLAINGYSYKPDFTIWRKDGTMLLWEHAGLMDDFEYARKFENKLVQYQSIGFTQAEKLIVTFDQKGAFSVPEARRMMELYRLI